MSKIQFKRGLEKDLPTLSIGEPGYATDTKTLYIGSASGNVKIAKIDDLNSIITSPVIPNSYSWVSTDGQDTFQIPNGKFYDIRLMSVTVGGVIQTNITLIDNKTFQLPETLSAGVNVYVEWYEVPIPITAGHHATHESGGQDEIDITKLKNYQEQIATPLSNKITKGDSFFSVKDYDAKGNANYYNSSDKNWYVDAAYTILANDDTVAFQTALDQKGKVVVPSGSYLIGGLIIHSNSQLTGLGKVTLHYKSGSGYASPFGTVMIANENLPIYHSPSDTNRQTLFNLANNITIENLTLDMQNSTTTGGIQLVCVDYANVKDVFIQNGREALDLRAIRYSTFTRVYADNIREDVISVTDQNFAAPTGSVHHGISRDLLFDTCRVTNSCFTNGTSTNAGMNAFEMDDGMYNVTFRDCLAMNNRGIGFEIHLHTSEYDMQDISFINCRSINNVPVAGATATVAQVSGFDIGQCPSGSTFKNITYENCVSIGSPTAFKNSPGAQSGYKENVTIIGGHWENTYSIDGTINTDNAVIALMKQFRSFKIIGANIVGNQDGYAFYSYGTGDGLKITNVTVKGCYIPLGLTHVGGRVEINNFTFDVTNPSNALSSICLAVECDDVVINGVMGKMDISKYSASIFRFINTLKNSIVGVNLENTGALGGNAIQFDTVGMATITGCNLKNFTNAVYLSNTSTAIVSTGNNFKGCTNKYSSTPTYLVDGANAI